MRAWEASQASLVLAVGGYGAALLVWGATVLLRRQPGRAFGAAVVRLAMGVGWLAHTWALAAHWYRAGWARPPLVTMYETLLLFAWVAAVLALALGRRYGQRWLVAAGALVALVAIGLAAAAQPPSITPLVPALQSGWLYIHVTLAALAYGLFGLAALLAALSLVQQSAWCKQRLGARLAAHLGQLELAPQLSYQAITLGMPLLTAVIVTGAVWAHDAWGRFWGWDPKEVWSLVTWMIYALYLHLRLRRGWRGAPLAWVAIGGFAAVVFTYLGVSLWLSGLHSYG